jgi:hypothetical protein
MLQLPDNTICPDASHVPVTMTIEVDALPTEYPVSHVHTNAGASNTRVAAVEVALACGSDGGVPHETGVHAEALGDENAPSAPHTVVMFPSYPLSHVYVSTSPYTGPFSVTDA